MLAPLPQPARTPIDETQAVYRAADRSMHLWVEPVAARLGCSSWRLQFRVSTLTAAEPIHEPADEPGDEG